MNVAPSLPYSLERLADRAEICDILHHWCRAIDQLDYSAMHAVFHPDAYDDHGAYQGGIDGLIDWIRARHPHIGTSIHALSNILIEFADADLAIVESRVATLQQSESPHARHSESRIQTMMAFVRYVDRFERRYAAWRIAHRTVIYEARIPVEAGYGGWPDQSQSSRRDRTDALYTLRAEAGLGDGLATDAR